MTIPVEADAPPYLAALTRGLESVAHDKLATPVFKTPAAPLNALLALSRTHPASVTIPLALSAAVAYPNNPGALSAIFAQLLATSRTAIDTLVSTLTVTPQTLYPTARLLHALLRLPWAPVLLEHRAHLLAVLEEAYPSGDLRSKAETLSLVHALGGVATEAGEKPFHSQTLAQDYGVFQGVKLGDEERGVLQSLAAEEEYDDPRLGAVLALFPLPTHLVLEALNHPSFKDESALIDAILAGNVPPELGLKAAVEDTNAPKPSQTNAARSGWSAEDVARLKVKNENSTPVAQEIPDTLRASILRLVEAQKEEEEAAARAIAEAHGEEEDDDDGEPRPPRMTAADGEESGEEQEGPVEGRKADSTQTLLELAYLRTPGVFARDAETRRSKGREELRDATGMDDSQIEGWRIMLERNPHKDAILERHQFSREAAVVKEEKKAKGGGGSGGSGSGSGQGNNHSNDTRGRGRGRGRASKSSRGHQNAQRTRGADRKAARMGTGL